MSSSDLLCGNPALRGREETGATAGSTARRDLQLAFSNFWTKRAKYPTFRSRKRSRRSAEYTTSAFRWRDGRLTLARMDQPLDIVWSRPLPDGASPSTVTVSQDAAGRWFVSLLCDDRIEQTPASGTVGIDAGLDSLLTLSAGEKITNPKHERADRQRLARAQRMPLTVRSWTCRCGTVHDRDVNAARNILAEGLSVAARGGGGKTSTRVLSEEQPTTKQETQGRPRESPSPRTPLGNAQTVRVRLLA